MTLFKDPKKPVIRQASRAADVSPLRPRLVAKRPPCTAHCGAGGDVRAWVMAITQAEASGRPPADACESAWRILAAVNPFPATLGRICPASCEHACHRRAREGAVAINALERWLGDVALARGFALPRLETGSRGVQVAVVGGGPAGLSCAYQLARRGHGVTVFEAQEMPGGRFRDATRTGRLASGTLDAEIGRIVRMGVALRCATPVPADLAGLDRDFDFVFVATGRGSRDGAALPEPADGRRVSVGGDAAQPGLVSAALAAGRRAAEAIDAATGGVPVGNETLPAIASDRLLLGWYQESARHDWPIEPAHGVASTAAEADVVAEASRCMSCGLCMDCERCWMYCTNNCFERLPKGEHYRVKVEACNGCRKCADECPCGYIDLV